MRSKLRAHRLSSCGLPVALRHLARRRQTLDVGTSQAAIGGVTLIIPAFNEARTIAAKVRNCAELDAPPAGLKIVIGCDGCTDATAEAARAAIAALGPCDATFEVVEFAENRGKVAVLNDLIAARQRRSCPHRRVRDAVAQCHHAGGRALLARRHRVRDGLL